jgi:hypothetical protein
MSERFYNNRRILVELREALVVERGFLFTCWRMLTRPAESLDLILSGTDRRFQDPIKFLFVCVALSTLAMNLNLGQQASVQKMATGGPAVDPGLKVAEEQLLGMIESPESLLTTKFQAKRALRELQMTTPDWFMHQTFKWMNLALLIAVPFYAVGTWLFFHRQFNFAEHMVINGYIFSIQCLLSLLTMPINASSMAWGSLVYFVISTAYQLVAWCWVFRIRGWREWCGCLFLLVAVSLIYFIATTLVMLAVTTTMFLWEA